MDIKTSLVYRLDTARHDLESILPRIDPASQIYPGWTLKQLLDHIAGWDNAVIASLVAHVSGRTPTTPAERGIDYYNDQTVTSHLDIPFEKTLGEFKATRSALKVAILDSPDEKLVEPMLVPWGRQGTMSEIVEVFSEHEETHTADLLRWLNDPDHPLEKQP